MLLLATAVRLNEKPMWFWFLRIIWDMCIFVSLGLSWSYNSWSGDTIRGRKSYSQSRRASFYCNYMCLRSGYYCHIYSRGFSTGSGDFLFRKNFGLFFLSSGTSTFKMILKNPMIVHQEITEQINWFCSHDDNVRTALNLFKMKDLIYFKAVVLQDLKSRKRETCWQLSPSVKIKSC